MACDLSLCSRRGAPIILSGRGGTVSTDNWQIPMLQAAEHDFPKMSKQASSSLEMQLDQLIAGQTEMKAELKARWQQMDTLVNGQQTMQALLDQLSTDLMPQRCNVQIAAPTELVVAPVANKLAPQEPKTLSPKSGATQSAFVLRAQERRIKRLKRVFEVDETVEREKAAKAGMTWRVQLEKVAKFNRQERLQLMNQVLDSAILVVVCLNAVFLGISIDNEQHEDVWFFFDMLFCAMFLAEIVFKIIVNGFRTEFCGNDKAANMFDVTLILLDALQFVLRSLHKSVGGPSLSLLRMARLGRFLRVLRLFKTEQFKDLLGMIQGVLGGLLTLGYSIVFFCVLVYVAALLCRELLGQEEKSNIYEYFDTVPRSMFTVFRCSFGDCSTSSGTPIFEYVTEAYGGAYGLGYCLFIFFMMIGLFNVISAIFVDSTMAAAAEMNLKRQQDRLADENRLSVSSTVLLRRILSLSTEGSTIINGDLTNAMDEILRVEVPRSVIDEAVKDPEVVHALHELDIDPHDHDKLSDILDPDHHGVTNVLDIMNGLQKLRGPPRRSDIVSVSLMVRSLQDTVEDLFSYVKGGGRS